MGSPDDRFPRMTAYLESLPRGTESYPAATSKASLIRHMQESMPFEASPGELPEALHALWEAPPPSSSWVPTAQFLALTLAYGDAHFPREADFLEWLYGLSAALYAKPLYRFLMYVATPRQLVHGAAKRWHQFHQGTDLELAEEGDGQAILAVRFPPKLYTPPVLGHQRRRSARRRHRRRRQGRPGRAHRASPTPRAGCASPGAEAPRAAAVRNPGVSPGGVLTTHPQGFGSDPSLQAGSDTWRRRQRSPRQGPGSSGGPPSAARC